jgi:hypothetical protein
MEPSFDIPKDRRRLSVGKLCLLMGVTALLYLAIANSFGSAAQAMLDASRMKP